MSATYTKSDLINELATSAKLSKRRVDLILGELARLAYREAANGFVVPGICKLDVVQRKERRARNPQTGEALLIGAHPILRVRPLKRAKQMVAPTPPNLITVLPPEAVPAPVEAPPPPAAAPAAAVASAPSGKAPLRLFSFACPYCAAGIEVTEDCVGDRIGCPACLKAFTVPAVGAKAKADAKPAAKAVAAPAASSEQYVSFLCKSCGQEIEAPIDMAGSQAECPACGTVMVVPYVSEPGTTQAMSGDVDDATMAAFKSRTIRIELPDDV